MANFCPLCNMENGVTSQLLKDKETGELVCKLNQTHRFRIDKEGFLELIKK